MTSVLVLCKFTDEVFERNKYPIALVEGFSVQVVKLYFRTLVII